MRSNPGCCRRARTERVTGILDEVGLAGEPDGPLSAPAERRPAAARGDRTRARRRSALRRLRRAGERARRLGAGADRQAARAHPARARPGVPVHQPQPGRRRAPRERVLVMYRGRIVESGARQSILGAPLHPYTRLLIDSVPGADPAARTQAPRAATAPAAQLPAAAAAAARSPRAAPWRWIVVERGCRHSGDFGDGRTSRLPPCRRMAGRPADRCRTSVFDAPGSSPEPGVGLSCVQMRKAPRVNSNERCIAHLSAGGLVLAADLRQARILRRLHDRAQVAAGRRVWPTAQVLPLDAWLGLQWDQASVDRPDLPRILPPVALRWLWRTQVARDAPSLLDPADLGARARASWLTLRAHGGDLADVARWPLTRDQQAFLGWARSVEANLRERGACDAGDLARLLVEAARCRADGPPILLAGFRRLTPAQAPCSPRLPPPVARSSSLGLRQRLTACLHAPRIRPGIGAERHARLAAGTRRRNAGRCTRHDRAGPRRPSRHARARARRGAPAGAGIAGPPIATTGCSTWRAVTR